MQILRKVWQLFILAFCYNLWLLIVSDLSADPASLIASRAEGPRNALVRLFPRRSIIFFSFKRSRLVKRHRVYEYWRSKGSIHILDSNQQPWLSIFHSLSAPHKLCLLPRHLTPYFHRPILFILYSFPPPLYPALLLHLSSSSEDRG